MALCKCRFCGESLLSKNAVVMIDDNKKLFFCSQEHKEIYIKHNTKSKQGLAQKQLEDFLWIDLMDRQGNFVAIKKQLLRYQSENNWKWSGMLYTAKYYAEMSTEPWNTEYGCGQIFECGWYEKAKEHLERVKASTNAINACDDDFFEDVTNYTPIPKKRSIPLKMAYESIEDL